jgi:predicted DNA-binding transcriptional regulator AlpA
LSPTPSARPAAAEPPYTADEVAALCRVCTKTLMAWVKAGTFPPPLPTPLPTRGRKRLWPASLVRRWLEGGADAR